MWRLLHQCPELSFSSAGGQEIPVLPLQVGALGPKGFREGRQLGSMHSKHRNLHGDIQTHTLRAAGVRCWI